jgi:hypothetical protein
MTRKGNNCGGTNRHHRLPKAQGGRDNWPPNNIALVPVCQHNLWNTIFHGFEGIVAVVKKINILLAKHGVQVIAEKI